MSALSAALAGSAMAERKLRVLRVVTAVLSLLCLSRSPAATLSRRPNISQASFGTTRSQMLPAISPVPRYVRGANTLWVSRAGSGRGSIGSGCVARPCFRRASWGSPMGHRAAAWAAAAAPWSQTVSIARFIPSSRFPFTRPTGTASSGNWRAAAAPRPLFASIGWAETWAIFPGVRTRLPSKTLRAPT